MVIWSLFDGSGLMVKDWAERGATCFCFNADEANHGAYSMRVEHPLIHYIDSWIEPGWNPAGRVMKDQSGQMLSIPAPDIIFSFPDCTFMAQSGSKHERTDEEVNYTVGLARVAEVLGTLYSVPWMVENPVGKLSTKWRTPDHYFDPYEYGGYISEAMGSFHPKMPLRDGYTKKTCLWTGNDFIMPEKVPVEHIGFFWGWKFLGGKSQKTKRLRSLTPRGFASAVCRSNMASVAIGK